MNRIEVTLTEDDYFAFLSFVQFRSKEARNAVLFVQFALPGAYFLYAAWKHWQKFNADLFGHDSLVGMLHILAFLCVFAVGMGLLMRRSMRKQIRKNILENYTALLGKPVAIELRDDGVFVQNSLGATTYPYASFVEITRHKNRVFAIISNDLALILPRDRIPAETLDAFLDELKKRMGEKS